MNKIEVIKNVSEYYFNKNYIDYYMSENLKPKMVTRCIKNNIYGILIKYIGYEK